MVYWLAGLGQGWGPDTDSGGWVWACGGCGPLALGQHHLTNQHPSWHLLCVQDVKSSNVLLTASGTAKLADVAFSRQLEHTFLSDLPLVGTFAW